ncbi:MAG: energy-coupling factor transporter transmembrane protein EcfT [Candidatus Lokiarchaeota archaeon]|nr:energy-coupling factor transporter transmembrane protein EcfT [Candidatus Lokiarchaeota archaeon]
MGKNKVENLDKKKLIFAYYPGNSFMHGLNPLSKLFFLIILTFIVFIIRSLILLSVISLLIIFTALGSGISLKNLAHKLKFMVILIVFSVIINIFFNASYINGEILFYLFGLDFLPIRRLALYYSLRVFFSVLSLYTSTIIYTSTTHMKHFVYALMKLKIPYTFCFHFMVGIRYIPMIEKEVKTIALAQKARGSRLEKVNSVKKAYNFIFDRLNSALVSILRKGYTTSLSMENRCFGIYKTRTNITEIRFRSRDFFFVLISLILFVFLLLYNLIALPIPQVPSLYQIFVDFLS